MKRLSGTGFIPAPHRGFYGWRVVLYASIALALTGPGQTFGVSVFVNPMIDDLGISFDDVNVNGGAVALGHPIGASGARVLTTLLYAMHKRDVQKGLATLCIGGGMGIAMCVERI